MEWIRGYGQRYRHLVKRAETIKMNGTYVTKIHFVCGITTECALDPLVDMKNLKPKCPQCQYHFLENY